MFQIAEHENGELIPPLQLDGDSSSSSSSSSSSTKDRVTVIHINGVCYTYPIWYSLSLLREQVFQYYGDDLRPYLSLWYNEIKDSYAIPNSNLTTIQLNERFHTIGFYEVRMILSFGILVQPGEEFHTSFEISYADTLTSIIERFWNLLIQKHPQMNEISKDQIGWGIPPLEGNGEHQEDETLFFLLWFKLAQKGGFDPSFLNGFYPKKKKEQEIEIEYVIIKYLSTSASIPLHEIRKAKGIEVKQLVKCENLKDTMVIMNAYSSYPIEIEDQESFEMIESGSTIWVLMKPFAFQGFFIFTPHLYQTNNPYYPFYRYLGRSNDLTVRMIKKRLKGYFIKGKSILPLNEKIPLKGSSILLHAFVIEKTRIEKKGRFLIQHFPSIQTV